MSAGLEYRFSYIEANSGASVYIHGYAESLAVAYSARVYAIGAPGVPYPGGHCRLTDGEHHRHSDGTMARLLQVQNLAPFNPCTVDILILQEAF